MADLTKSGRAAIEGDEIVIRVAIEALDTIVEGHPELCGFKVTNPSLFAQEIVDELNWEEGGSTFVWTAFDNAIYASIEGGAEGVKQDGEESLVELGIK